MVQMELTALIENQSQNKKLKSQHSLALLLRVLDKTYLIDTGKDDKFIQNAQQMGIDLTKIDGVILSHNHFDHVGGLDALMKLNPNLQIYAKEELFQETYLKKLFVKIPIGMKRKIQAQYKHHFHFFKTELALTQYVKLHSIQVTNETYFMYNPTLTVKKDERYSADNFDHELFVTVESDHEVVIISSCSHNGIINIVENVQQKYPDKQIRSVIGGFHMMGFGFKKLGCEPNFIKEVAHILDQVSVDKVYTCHCTGPAAYSIIHEEIGDRIGYFSTGDTIKLELY